MLAQDLPPGRGLNSHSNEKEVALGKMLASEFRQKASPVNNATVSEYVQRVGARLAAQVSSEWTFQFGTLRSPSGGPTREPVTFPGGYIFVSTDLISSAQNEAEFAGMVAHAMAHISARHWTRSATRGELAQKGGPVVGVMPNYSDGMAMPMGMLALQRAFEKEADFLAVPALAAAGYDPAGLASYLNRVQPPVQKSKLLEALPAREQRVAAIRTEIAKLPAAPYQTSGEFARVQAALAQ